MRIVSYNVNGLRSRLSSPARTLAAFLDSLDADIICLQETKVARHELSADMAVAEGYESFFSCTRTAQKGRIGYSGVATFCRVGPGPSSTSPILPLAADEGFTGLLHRAKAGAGNVDCEKGRVGCYEEVARTELSMQELLKLDSEGRCLITDHGSFVLFNLYCPRVGGGDKDRLEFKVNFFNTLQRRWEGLLNHNRRIIAVGDFNVSPYAIDSCCPGPDFDQNVCRKWLRSMLQSEGGPFWDVFRVVHRDRKDAYTCWSQSSGAEEFNFGTRIDLVLAAGHCNHEMVPTGDAANHCFVKCEVQDSDILSHFRRMKLDSHPRWQGGRTLKLEGSDHAPIMVHLKEQRPVAAHEVPPLAARFMPEIRGRQQSLVNLLQTPRLPVVADRTKFEVNVEEPELAGDVSEMPGSTLKPVTVPRRSSESGANVPPFSKKRGQKPSTTSLESKRHGATSVRRSEHQQKDLRVFFVSSPQVGGSVLKEEIRQPNLECSDAFLGRQDIADADSGSQLSLKENLDFGLSQPSTHESSSGHEQMADTSNFERPVGDAGMQASRLNPDGIFREIRDGCCQRRTEAADLTQVEQPRPPDGTEPANAAWKRIKEKMARAVPLCQGHGEPCVARMVKKPGPNKGRGFYVCARAEGPASNPEARCDHFEWASSFKKGGTLLSGRTNGDESKAYLRRVS